MNNEFIQQEIFVDESIERIIRIIHQQVILFYQAYEDFHKLSNSKTDLKLYEDTLNNSLDKIAKIRNVCVKEFDDFGKDKTEFKDHLIIKELQIMVTDINKYYQDLNMLVAQILNNNNIDSDKYRSDINKLFDDLFKKYTEFINADTEVITYLKTLANKHK
ncbi:MAG: hypothetical protein ACP5N1_03385 [Candidatus Woesearchaeota archaeon]